MVEVPFDNQNQTIKMIVLALENSALSISWTTKDAVQGEMGFGMDTEVT